MKIRVTAVLLMLLCFCLFLFCDAQKLSSIVGWYSGDSCDCPSGLLNRFSSDSNYGYIYGEFIVPEGGWTVVGLFSNNWMNFKVTRASWEIRASIDLQGGRLIASGTSRATQVPLTPMNPHGQADYKIQVDGLKMRLEPGQYWARVTPIGFGTSFGNVTTGLNAVNASAGGTQYSSQRLPAWHQHKMGSGAPIKIDFQPERNPNYQYSQGVLILPTN